MSLLHGGEEGRMVCGDEVSFRLMSVLCMGGHTCLVTDGNA